MSITKIDPAGEFAAHVRTVLAELAAVVGDVNVRNGWDTSRGMVANPEAYDPKWQVAHKIAELGLIDTEVSEAIEEVRHGHRMDELYFTGGMEIEPHGYEPMTPSAQAVDDKGRLRKPEGVPAELADVVIRVLDIADAYGIDLGAAIIAKLNHNATRGMHHGGKAL